VYCPISTLWTPRTTAATTVTPAASPSTPSMKLTVLIAPTIQKKVMPTESHSGKWSRLSVKSLPRGFVTKATSTPQAIATKAATMGRYVVLIGSRSAPQGPRRTTKEGRQTPARPHYHPLPARSLRLAVIEVVQIETVDEVAKRRHPLDLFFVYRANQIVWPL